MTGWRTIKRGSRKPRGHWLTWDGRDETRDALARQLKLLYFGNTCCCGANVHPELGIWALLRHTWHALRCRVGLCVWRSEP